MDLKYVVTMFIMYVNNVIVYFVFNMTDSFKNLILEFAYDTIARAYDTKIRPAKWKFWLILKVFAQVFAQESPEETFEI